jgi:hypothetical protein
MCSGWPSFCSLVLVRSWQKGQSIHCGSLPSRSSGTTRAPGPCCAAPATVFCGAADIVGSGLGCAFRSEGRPLTGTGVWFGVASGTACCGCGEYAGGAAPMLCESGAAAGWGSCASCRCMVSMWCLVGVLESVEGRWSLAGSRLGATCFLSKCARGGRFKCKAPGTRHR